MTGQRPVRRVRAVYQQVLLSALKGPEVPASFHGGLPFTYHAGPGPAAATLTVDMDQTLGPIYTVVASLRGTASPERSILLGTHHDAWTETSGAGVWRIPGPCRRPNQPQWWWS